MNILVTRPAADQKQTIDSLAELGIQAISSPAMEARRLDFHLPASTPQNAWQGVIITSRNALRMLGDWQLDQLRGFRLHCVGGQTEALARSLGFEDVGATAPDISHLTNQICTFFSPQAGPILYLTAKHRSGKLAQALVAHGFDHTLIETYEMVGRGELSDEAVDAIKNKRLDGVLLYSSRTSCLILALIEKYNFEVALQAVTFYCLSHAVALPLQEKGYPCVVSDAPNEISLLACVKRDHNYLI